MSKLKIDKSASRIRRVPLKTTIDGTVADDLELMCEWSDNETSYVVNQLLRFALGESEDFQAHKRSTGAPQATNEATSQVRTRTVNAKRSERTEVEP